MFNVLYSQNTYSALQITASGIGSCDILVADHMTGESRQEIFPFLQRFGAHSPSYSDGNFSSFLGVKQQGHEGDLIYPAGAKIKIL